MHQNPTLIVRRAVLACAPDAAGAPIPPRTAYMSLRLELPAPPRDHAYISGAGLHAWRSLQLTSGRGSVHRESTGAELWAANSLFLGATARAAATSFVDGSEQWTLTALFGPQAPYTFYHDEGSGSPPLALAWRVAPTGALLSPLWRGAPLPPPRVTLECQLV